MIEQVLHPQLVQALGWTLLHSLWQGAAFALVLALLLIGLRSYTAQARYTVAAGLLAAFFISVGGTFWQQWQQAEPNVRSADATLSTSQGSAFAPVPLGSGTGLHASHENNPPALASNETLAVTNDAAPTPLWKSARQTLSAYYTEHLPLLVTLWLMGILVLQLRFLGQLAFVQRLKHYGTKAFPEAWSGRIEELEGKLRIQKKVVYRTTLRTSSPMVIGWLKPVVLFPQLMLNKLSDTEIYAVLAHELAHVRRDDFAVNLIQTLLTNVFFFHPGAWWMSNRVDEEREHCCDDLAIIATGEALPYAKTLLNVSHLHRASTTVQPQLAMAMSGTDQRKKGSGFAQRIKRLFSSNSAAGTFREGFATACILFAGLGMAFAFTNQTEVSLAEHLNTFEKSKAENPTALTPIIENETLPLPPAPVAPPKPGQEIEPPTEPATTTTTVITSTTSSSSFPVQSPLLPFLLTAIKAGDLEKAQQLLDQGAPVNGTFTEANTYQTLTPLLLATAEKELDIVKLLVGRGAEVNAVTNGWTPLLEAADEGANESLKYLLQSGALLNWHQGPNSPTALTMAASEGKFDCLLSLIKAGADVNGFGESLPPLHAAAAEGKIEILRALLARGADVNTLDAVGRTALMYAASEGKEDVVALLVSSKADPNLTDNTGMRALEFALEEGAEDLAQFLTLITDGIACSTHLQPGHVHSDVHVDFTPEGWSKQEQKRIEIATQEAIRNERRQVESMVRAQEVHDRHVQHSARQGEAHHEINFRSNQLIEAIEDGNTRQINSLLNAGADANVRDEDGRTALSIAILLDKADATSLLLKHGADPQSRMHAGWTPLHYAALQGNDYIIALLLQHQPNLEARANYSSTDGSPKNSLLAWDYVGATPLLIAVENDDYACVQLLLEAGANPDTRLQKVEYKRSNTGTPGFDLSQVTNAEQRTTQTSSKVIDDWSPRRQAEHLQNSKILALL